MKMMGDYSVLPSNESSSSPVNPAFQGSSSTSGPPCAQSLLTSQGPPRSQASISDLRKQLRKRTVFSQEQKLVLQEHFDECMHPNQEQCMALAQRLGLKESHIKMWFKNRRARQNRKNSQEVPGEPGSGSHDRPACSQGSVPLGASASADSLRQSPELQNHPSTVSEPSQQMSQSPLIPPGVLMQSSLQRHSDHERIPRPHVSPDPSTKPSPQLLGTRTAHPRHQIPLSSSVSSGCKGSQVPIASSDKCDDQQVHPEAPRKQRKERTVYSEEQKVLLQRHFDQDKHPSVQKCMELALMIGVTEYEIKIWFKNRRAKENLKKAQELPGNPSYGSQDRTDSPTGHAPLVPSASADSQSQSPCKISSTPHLSSSSNSSDHEPEFSTADQMFEEECFKKSPLRERQQRQKNIELADKGGHQSHGRYGLLEYCILPDALATSDSRHETQSSVSAPPVLSHLNIAPHSEPTFSMCQRPSLGTPPPQLISLNNSLDQVSIFSIIDRACEEILKKNKRSREQRQQRKKARELPQMGGQDSHAKCASPNRTVLMASAFEDFPSQRQMGVDSPPQVSSSIISPDSESMFSMWGSPFHDSFPPPLSPSIFPEPNSTFSINQINGCLLHETLKYAQARQSPAAEDRIPGQSANCATSPHPTPTQDPDPVCPPVSSTASTAAAEAATKTAGTESETESADPTPVSENNQGYKENADQLFIENLCKLDALLGPLSQPDLCDDFPVLDFF